MQELLTEYHALVVGARHLLEKKLRKKENKKKTIPPILAPAAAAAAPLPLASVTKESTPKEEPLLQKITPSPTPHTKAIEEIKQGSFILEKTKHFTPLDLTPIKEIIRGLAPPQAALLSLSKEGQSFLEKVAAALTKHGLHATAYTLTAPEDFFTTSMHTIFITEWHPSLTKIASVQKEYHKLFTFSHQKRILLLHPINSYETDSKLKQHLWHTLKTHLLP